MFTLDVCICVNVTVTVKFNIVSMENIKNGFRPILCVSVCVSIDAMLNLMATLTQTQTQTSSVNTALIDVKFSEFKCSKRRHLLAHLIIGSDIIWIYLYKMVQHECSYSGPSPLWMSEYEWNVSLVVFDIRHQKRKSYDKLPKKNRKVFF